MKDATTMKMSRLNLLILNKRIIPTTVFLLLIFFGHVFAETVTGGGYRVEQSITPLQGGLTGAGYVLQQGAQSLGGTQTGGGYTVQGVYGTGTAATSTPPPPPPITYGGGGGGYYVFPSSTTTTNGNLIIENKSTCSSRITFTRPIDLGLSTNLKEDVIKLESFLNRYENERLTINGIYEKKDQEAVKRFQSKYKSYILDPMGLKKPTGTVYTLTQRHIERKSSASCGQAIVVTACPFFKEYASYGDRGDVVKKLQQFLNIVRGEKVPVSGVFGPLTKEAVKRFQRASRQGLFDAFRYGFISGNWNEATRIKANQAIGCDVVK